MSETTDKPRALVLGGGVAGIAAALRLADEGVAVTLVETRRRLGGRATSFDDPRTGTTLDNCQHVVLGCCTRLLGMYERLGVADRIAWHRRYHFADGDGRVHTLASGALPAPLHMGPSFARCGLFGMGEKLAIARGMAALWRGGPAEQRAWAGRRFDEWLADHGQGPGARAKFWEPVVVSACNERLDRVAAPYAIQVFQEGFLAGPGASAMGVPSVPLVSLYDGAERAIERSGGAIRLGASVSRIELGERGVAAVHAAGERHVADAVISALPFDRLARALPAGAGQHDARFRGLEELEVSPIVGIHLFFEAAGAAPFPWPHLVLPNATLQWAFDQGVAEGDSTRVQHVHGVVSAARDLIEVSAEEIADRAVADLARAVPAIGSARLVNSRVIKEKRATFSLTPEADRLRPAARGATRGLYLAGDWCETGWPATMEGAARSGEAAASAAIADLGT